MAKVTGFLEHDREENSSIAPESRIKNFREFIIPFSEAVIDTEVGFTAVLDKSEASDTAEADTVP